MFFVVFFLLLLFLQETYGSFHYTSLLYLTTYEADFQGGRFVFVDGQYNRTVEPRLGKIFNISNGFGCELGPFFYAPNLCFVHK